MIALRRPAIRRATSSTLARWLLFDPPLSHTDRLAPDESPAITAEILWDWFSRSSLAQTDEPERRFSLSHFQGDMDMLRNFSKLANDEHGFIISAELVLVMTIAVLGMVVGLTAVRDSIVEELNDVSHAFGAINQSYNYNGLKKSRCWGDIHAFVAGSGFNDTTDDCDCKPIEFISVNGKNDSSNGTPNEGNGW